MLVLIVLFSRKGVEPSFGLEREVHRPQAGYQGHWGSLGTGSDTSYLEHEAQVLASLTGKSKASFQDLAG